MEKQSLDAAIMIMDEFSQAAEMLSYLNDIREWVFCYEQRDGADCKISFYTVYFLEKVAIEWAEHGDYRDKIAMAIERNLFSFVKYQDYSKSVQLIASALANYSLYNELPKKEIKSLMSGINMLIGIGHILKELEGQEKKAA